MSQQAQNDYYEQRGASSRLDYAAAVNEEIRDLFAAGADIVQIDEPYMQARPEKAREYGLDALERALDGVDGTTAVHICFGYAAIIHERPEGYSFLPELARTCACDQISIETAQSEPRLLGARRRCRARRSSSACSTSTTHEVETPETRRRADPARAALQCRRASWSSRPTAG